MEMIEGHGHGCMCHGCVTERADSTSDSDTPTPPGEAGATKPVYSTAQVINALRTADGAQSTLAWTGNTVEYSIETGKLVPGQGNYSFEHNGYVSMDDGMVAAAREAFELWDELIAIDLVEVQSDPAADITFNYTSASGGSSYASYSYWGSAGSRGAFGLQQTDIWLAHNWWTHDQGSDLKPGSFGIGTYLHEIGHALGLSHLGNYNGTAGYAANATHFQDTRAYSIMSYFNASDNGSGTDHFGTSGLSYSSTPMLHDILAVQSIYGADMTTRTEATVYGFNATADREAFDFTVNTNPVVAIWDAGGIDKIDVSGWSMNQVVDLNDGAFSSVGHLTQNLAIAYGAEIEMAETGDGNDRLVGNELANVLSGNGGSDTLEGGAGADILWGGTGADVLDGGEGADWARFNTSFAAVSVNLNSGIGAGGDAEGDTFTDVEHAQGSAYGDLLTGDHLTANQFLGLDGDDTIFGGGGHDFLLGGGGDDQIYGGTGRDVIRGGAGGDTLDGGTSPDWVQYHASTSGGIVLDLGAGTGSAGDAAGDVLISIENIRGTNFDDTITGSSIRNILYGEDGDDVIFGGGGNDVLYGQGGTDTLIGSSGQDTFHGGA
ncbi:MAG: M10 family metallopeptidase, partial [Pseudomonadota bacterium]